MSSAAHVDDGGHSAVNAALGFYYQSLYGLLSIVKASHDDAAVCLERLDDVEILTNGQSLLSQLKHSLSKKPAAVTLSSVALWKTLKAWIDVLPAISLSDNFRPSRTTGTQPTTYEEATKCWPFSKMLVGTLTTERCLRRRRHDDRT